MTCLLLQFKCQPDTFSIHFRAYNFHPTHPSTNRYPVCFRAQCTLSATSPPSSTSTTVLDLEKLRSLTLEAKLDSIATNEPWSFLEAIGPPNEVNFGATLATETLITSDEAVITAAAAEAVALAKAAVKVAKDVTLMVNSSCCLKTEAKLASSSADSFSSRWPQLTQAERASILGDSVAAEIEQSNEYSLQHSSDELELLEPTQEELSLLEKQLSDGVAVRSKRHTERKARRVRAVEKAATTEQSVRSGPTSKKRRGAVQEVDFSDPLRYFRGTTSTSRLLSAKEEIKMSAGIQDLLKLERLKEELAEPCEGQSSFAQWAAAAGVDQKALRKRLNYGVLCKDRMIKSNIRLVISIAKRYQGVGMNLQDLVQEGCRGLVRGAEKFDASKGFKFSTYAHWWIRQAIRRFLSEQSRTIRLPFHMVEATYRVKEARRQLYTENGRHPHDEEVAEATGLSMKRLSAVLLTPKPPRSLDQKIGLNMDMKPSEIIADPDAETAEDILMKQFMKQDLDKVLDSLSPREKQVIRLRFGLEDGRTKTLQEIGEMVGVSRERIRQIESSAFRKLKNKKRTRHLKQYLVS